PDRRGTDEQRRNGGGTDCPCGGMPGPDRNVCGRGMSGSEKIPSASENKAAAAAGCVICRYPEYDGIPCRERGNPVRRRKRRCHGRGRHLLCYLGYSSGNQPSREKTKQCKRGSGAHSVLYFSVSAGFKSVGILKNIKNM